MGLSGHPGSILLLSRGAGVSPALQQEDGERGTERAVF